MSDLYVLRRANGELFTEEVGGKLYIPVWRSEEAVARYKARNPELIVFLPRELSRPLMSRIANGLGREGTREFFLLSEEDPDADLFDGRPVSLEEIFPEGENAPQPATAQA